jgi:hypothetical protein
MAQQNQPAAARGANWLRRAVTAVINAVSADTMIEKTKQGATEVANALYAHHSNAYSPVTADKATDNVARAAHRAQFQSKDTSRGMER